MCVLGYNIVNHYYTILEPEASKTALMSEKVENAEKK